jgi:hypothetical protein
MSSVKRLEAAASEQGKDDDVSSSSSSKYTDSPEYQEGQCTTDTTLRNCLLAYSEMDF